MSKDDLIKEIYLRVSDETDMGDLVKEEDFVAVVPRRVLYDYILVSKQVLSIKALSCLKILK